MAKGKRRIKAQGAGPGSRVKLTADESLKRMEEFSKRKEHFIASVRKGKDRVYLPDVPRPAYQDLLNTFQEEFTYTFGGRTTARGLEGNYLSRTGLRMRDRINLVYTDTPFAFEESFARLSRYADELRQAADDSLEEEAILVAVLRVFHAE